MAAATICRRHGGLPAATARVPSRHHSLYSSDLRWLATVTRIAAIKPICSQLTSWLRTRPRASETRSENLKKNNQTTPALGGRQSREGGHEDRLPDHAHGQHRRGADPRARSGTMVAREWT